MPSAVEHITREHVEAFIGDLVQRFKPGTASDRYRALQVFAAAGNAPLLAYHGPELGRGGMVHLGGEDG
jgi:hypothetical protein